MKTKNSYPSSEFEEKDICPSCGSFCNIHSDLDDNDECNDCRNQIDGLEMGQIIPKEEPKQETLEECLETAAIDYRDKSDDENTNEETMLINVNWYDKQEAFIAGAKWQQEQIGKSEFLQRLRGTLSDAEARRLIFETFKNK